MLVGLLVFRVPLVFRGLYIAGFEGERKRWSRRDCSRGLRYKSIGEASLATLSGYGTNIYILLPPPICIWKPLIQKDRIEYYYSM